MSFRLFEKYMKICRANGVLPTLIGAERYKKTGLI